MSRILHASRPVVVAAAAWTTFAFVAGAQIVPLEERLDLAAGGSAVVPVAVDIVRGAAPTPVVMLADGRRIPATLYRLEADLAPRQELDAAARAWLGPAMRWRVTTPGETPADEGKPAAWALLLDLPGDASGAELTIDGAPVPVNWLATADPEATLPMRELPRTFDTLKSWVPALQADPLERWRASLLMELLLRDGANAGSERPASPAPHPALEALARQEEDRWRAALQRLSGVDAGLCAEIVSALCEVIDFGAGRIAPAWAPIDTELHRLRGELLDPRQSNAQLAHLARLWLATRPGLTTWVIDDAGASDARGVPIVAIGVAERRGRAEMAGLRLPGLGLPEEGRRTPLRPFGRIVMVRSIEAGPGAVTVEVAAGDRRSRELVLCNPVEISPPGLVIGPLLRDWSMADWDAGAPSPAVGDGATAALLQRGVRRDSWELYIECRTPTAPASDDAQRGDDHVRVWLGPTIGPAAILRITETGEMVDEMRPDAETSRLAVQRETDRWSVIVPIPPAAIGPDGVLRLAMQRVDGSGERSTWPRALLPWQETPGRIAVNLAAWREVGARE